VHRTVAVAGERIVGAAVSPPAVTMIGIATMPSCRPTWADTDDDDDEDDRCRLVPQGRVGLVVRSSSPPFWWV
jgi:hypothetical protein